MWDNINTGGSGSEGGLILKDEEYKKACRITLEKCHEYYAVTCGIYGAMVHTAFCRDDAIYYSMKKDLQEFIDRETTSDEEYIFYEYFTTKY